MCFNSLQNVFNRFYRRSINTYRITCLEGEVGQYWKCNNRLKASYFLMKNSIRLRVGLTKHGVIKFISCVRFNLFGRQFNPVKPLDQIIIDIQAPPFQYFAWSKRMHIPESRKRFK